jgi:hypothetical protein
MGGAVRFEPSTKAQDTTTVLQQAVRSGLPVLIPGAYEPRAGHAPVSAAADVVTNPGILRPRAAEVLDRAQLEREREGGGAPRNRMAVQPRGMLARLWRRVLRGPDAQA